MKRTAATLTEIMSSASAPSRRASSAPSCRVFFDFETSGKGCASLRQHRIIEIGAVRGSAGGSWDIGRTGLCDDDDDPLPSWCFRTLVAGGPCTAQTTEKHGLRDEDLEGAPSFTEAWEAFVAFVKRAQKDDDATVLILVGHNSSSTDSYWLLSELYRARRSLWELRLSDRTEIFFEDTYPSTVESRAQLKLALAVPDVKNGTLYGALYTSSGGGVEKSSSSLGEGENEEESSAPQSRHTALWDCCATRDMWCASSEIRRRCGLLTAEEQIRRWVRCASLSGSVSAGALEGSQRRL